jgi:hypothetical protein
VAVTKSGNGIMVGCVSGWLAVAVDSMHSGSGKKWQWQKVAVAESGKVAVGKMAKVAM